MATATRMDDPIDVRVSTIGKVIPHVEVRFFVLR